MERPSGNDWTDMVAFLPNDIGIRAHAIFALRGSLPASSRFNTELDPASCCSLSLQTDYYEQD
jgi:hypothetical protein